jgi:hypothetical protein
MDFYDNDSSNGNAGYMQILNEESMWNLRGGDDFEAGVTGILISYEGEFEPPQQDIDEQITPTAVPELLIPEWLPDGVELINAQEFIANWNLNLVILVREEGSDVAYRNIGNAQIVWDDIASSYKLRTVTHVLRDIQDYEVPEVVLALGLDPSSNPAAYQLISENLDLSNFSDFLTRNVLNEDGSVDSCTFEYQSEENSSIPDFVINADGYVEMELNTEYVDHIRNEYKVMAFNSDVSVTSQLNLAIIDNPNFYGLLEHDYGFGYSLLNLAGNAIEFRSMTSFDASGNPIESREEYSRDLPADNICSGDSGSPLAYSVTLEDGNNYILVDEMGRPYLLSSISSILNAELLSPESNTFCSEQVITVIEYPPCDLAEEP